MSISAPKDGQYSSWEATLVDRYPLALSEMRRHSQPLGTFGCQAVARWGIECHPGWRQIVERLLDGLETAIATQPADRREQFRIVQLKEKFGLLTVYLAGTPTPDMSAVIQEAREASRVTCEVCAEPGRFDKRRGWFAVRCAAHEDWVPQPWLV